MQIGVQMSKCTFMQVDRGGWFVGIVAAGAMNAIRDTGADAEILYSSDFEKMVRQLRESIGLGVMQLP